MAEEHDMINWTDKEQESVEQWEVPSARKIRLKLLRQALMQN